MSAKKLKAQKKFLPGRNDIKWDELVKTVETIKVEADKKLEEISTICLNRECNVKQR